jgi:tetratricopeptide (TPR) repeat protein
MHHFQKSLYKTAFCAIIGITCFGINANSQVKISEQEWILPTYLVDPPDKNPMFFKGESYQGASKVVYPYGLTDVISTEKADHGWKALILENEYIKLCVTPEIGGKLYYATDKTNNYNFIYKNNVVKPSNIGMLGAWVSGGIEWCVIHHHRASTFLPVDYELVENEDGSKTIWVGETEPRHRMKWTIGITAYPERSYFMAETRIFNPTPYTNTFLFWANVATHTNKDYQVIFPPSVQFATFHAKNSFTRWPFSTEVYNGQDFTKGVDVSWWINSPNSASFFAHDLKEDFMGGYDHGRATGTVHIGDHNIVKGAKLWEWGSGPRGQATEGRLTENDGPYVEIMTGAFSDNQPDYSWIRPYEVKTFRQYWYPVKDIGGFRNANLNGAVNLEKRDKGVFLGFYSTRKVSNAKVYLKKNDKTIFEKNIIISPEKAFAETIKTGELFKETELTAGLIDMETGEELISYNPAEKKNDEPLPETVKRPPAPKDIKTIEELFLAGSRILQFYNPTLNAMDYFNEALNRDPGDIRTNTAIGNIHLKNGDYKKARISFSRAIERLTRDYTRPSACEPLYLQGVTLKALGLFDEATDTLYRATWDYSWHSAAYLELARISVHNGDLIKAREQIEESLSTNSRNHSAISLKASILRLSGDYAGAASTIKPVLESDPLNFRAANEAYFTAKASGDDSGAEKILSLIEKRMREFEQNYLELSVGYINDGLYKEAEEVLKRFRGSFPIVSYYLGYLADKAGNKTEAERHFKNASGQSTDDCFPYRLETISVLETALKYNASDSRAYYYLGNILYDKQPEKAIGYWEAAVKNDPLLAVAHRNLGWGYYRHYGDGIKAITAYEKAISLKKDEPVYYEELDALYEMSNSPVEKRLKLFEASNAVVSKRDDAFARQITVLTLAGRYEEAVQYLTGKSFSYREGSSRVRDILIDAHLMLGIKYLKEKDYKSALDQFILSQVPEEEAGGSRSGNRNLQVDYFIGIAYEALGNKTKARSYFTLSTAQESRNSSYIMYYQGLSFAKLGKKKEATDRFNALIEEGDRQIKQSASAEVDFFAKFGEREAENARLSNAFLIKGLGYKGLGNMQQANENLKKAVELSAANLVAKTELENQ